MKRSHSKEDKKLIKGRVILITLSLFFFISVKANSETDTIYFNFTSKTQQFNSNSIEIQEGIGVLIKSIESNKIINTFCFDEIENKSSYFYSMRDTIYYLSKDSNYIKFKYDNIKSQNYFMNYFRFFPSNLESRGGSIDKHFKLFKKERIDKKNKFVELYKVSNDYKHIEYFDTIESLEVGNKYVYASYNQIDDNDSIFLLKQKMIRFFSNTPEELGYKLRNNKDERKSIIIGDTLNNYWFQTLEGAKVSFDDINSNIIVVDFWYTSCLPCIKLMKNLPEIKSNFDKRVSFISLNNIDMDIQKVKNALSFHKITEHENCNIWLEADKGQFSKDYRVSLYPTLLILNKDLVVLDKIEGYIESNKKKIIKRIQKQVLKQE